MSRLYFLLFLSVPILYIVASFILLRKPHWIHRKRRPAFIVRKIGHRGGAGEGIENTIEAFENGLKSGLEMLEIDCYLTRDGQVVVHHDPTLNRTAGQAIAITETNYRDLPALKNPMELYYNSETMITCDNKDNEFDTVRIPLLQDVFRRFPTTPINIDVKQNNDQLIRQISQLIQDHQRVNITYWGSFSDVVFKKLAAENPAIVRFCSLKEVAWIVFSYWLGFLPFISISGGVFEIPMPGEVVQGMARNANCLFKFVLFIIEKTLNRRSLFVHLQKRGIPVYVWILNNDKEYRRAFHHLRVTGVMTDYPTRLTEYLASHSHRFILTE